MPICFGHLSQDQLLWDGLISDIDMKEPIVDIKPGRLRLVADGSQARLANARMSFSHSANHSLDILIEQRAIFHGSPGVDEDQEDHL